MAQLVAQYDYSDRQAYLNLLYEALAHASQGKSYSLRGKTYTRQSLAELRAEINAVNREILIGNGRSSVVFGRHSRSR